MSTAGSKKDFLDLQADIYHDLGQALFDMLDPEHHHDWEDVHLEARQGTTSDGQQAHAIRVTLRLMGGLELPLLPPPEVTELCRRLDLLAREQLDGKTWESFLYRLYHGPRGPAYAVSYTYSDAKH